MNLLTTITTLLITALMLASSAAAQDDSKHGIFDNSLDVGDAVTPGSSVFDDQTERYVLTSPKNRPASDEAAFQYLWKAIQGDFILRAHLEFVGSENDGNRSIGWAVRNGLEPEASSVNAVLYDDGTAVSDFREERGGAYQTIESEFKGPNVIQLSRVNGRFTMSVAIAGEPLQHIDIGEIELNNEVFAGLFIYSENSSTADAAIFHNVRITKPAPEGFEQYDEYLGSRLEVVDVETGTRDVLYETEHSIQAPNWTPDDEKLIYNSNGLLFNYLLENGQITPLNTGFATQNNNDHVVTFDGTQIAISHHNPEDDNHSTIYTLPIEGSDNPKQVTPSGVGPSYLHGVSPDNQTVIYTGLRNGQYDIYAADVNTMEETQLTDTPGLDDGSEYSPDGETIYFNSNRTGTMQIWKMDADGSNQTQLTFDKSTHDWFPHISPDGKWIVFLSYGLDVDSGAHPFYKQVTLQVMPAEGGEPRIIAYLYGGQGTINVPSWSPDSKKVAFVSNSGRFR